MNPRLVVQKTGLLATVQDFGRFGFRRIGVPCSGALCPELMTIANLLAGNSAETAVIEFFSIGPTLQLERGRLRIAIAGDCRPWLERNKQKCGIRSWRSFDLEAGDRVRIGELFSGRAGYLAIAGGLATSPVLNSHSTWLRGQFGGIDGAALSSGMVVPVTAADVPVGPNLHLPRPPLTDLPGSAGVAKDSCPPVTIRVVKGPQIDHFGAAAWETFLSGTYRVSRETDRMGSRLEGPQLCHRSPAHCDIISEALVPGAIQVPGNGLPIVMLADCPTVGGYPKIATVISCDIPKISLLPPGSRLYFEAVGIAEADRLLKQDGERRANLIRQIRPVPGLSEPFEPRRN